MKALIEAERGLLTIEQKNLRERLEILSGYPDSREAEMLFQWFGLMHIIAPHLPDKIKTNFFVSPLVLDFIGRMYASEGRKAPEIYSPSGKTNLVVSTGSGYDAVVTFTGGKDSLWNNLKAREEFGDERVMLFHLSGLNQSVAARELEYVLKQANYFGWDLEVVKIKNSASSRGFIMMRSRDFFAVAMAVPTAINRGASRILLEGGFSMGAQENEVAFSYRMSAWKAFNKMLARIGLPVEAAWYDQQLEIGKIKELLEQKPEWLKLVINCLSMPCFVPGIRREILEKVGDFPFYETQCGGCVKCRMVNIARILYDPEMARVDQRVIKAYLISTIKWLARKKPEVEDIVDESFFEAVDLALQKYGLA